MLTKNDAITRINQLGSTNQAFSFYCDFLGEKWCIQEDSSENQFYLEIGQKSFQRDSPHIVFEKYPTTFEKFKESFDRVIHEINFGNSFLTNLTFQTLITSNLTLEEIFNFSTAKYRLHVPGKFVVFSPETFIKISGNTIYSYPMKGTIDAGISNAEGLILGDTKEKAEHVTIVDLIRNDLSQVASEVKVTKFRYLDIIKTNHKELLQVSSEITGVLSPNWKNNLGSLLAKLLPAGSISGAPKPETIRIINEYETYERGFYTGICGHFDGSTLDTGVMIRFIKLHEGELYYCSGGGITSSSNAKKEYQEMVDKIYLSF